MPHIQLDPMLPGIRSLFAFRPETAKPLSELAHILLHAESSLTRAERELIATHVSYRNDCFYCQTAHGAIASYQLGGNDVLVDQQSRPGAFFSRGKIENWGVLLSGRRSGRNA